MNMSNEDQHNWTRELLRFMGLAVTFVGVSLTLVGIGSFFAAFGTFEPPKYFWCAFLGMPLIFVGFGLCKFAYMGPITRYMANEVAPVGKDVVNYMADGTQGAVRNVAAAVGEGLRSGFAPKPGISLRCNRCQTENQAPANFCKGCGNPLATTKACTGCGKANDSDSRFCDHCGKALS